MNRPLAAFSLAYVTGIIMWRIWMESPMILAFFAALLLSLGAYAYFRQALSIFMGGLLLAIMAAGAVAAVTAASPSPGGLLGFAGSPVYVEGTLVEEPRYDAGVAVYRVKVEAVEAGGASFPVTGDLQVRIYHREDPPNYWYGERLRLRGKIVEPRGKRNPGGFDYRLYLKTQGVEALMYLQPHQATSLGAGEVGRLTSMAFSLRSRMVEGIASNLPSPHAELLSAILFGQRHRLPENIQENFIRAGVGHLMAVSGLHVGLVAALILFIFRPLGRNSIPVIILAVLLLFLYAFITGMRPPALRAAIMFSMGMAALLWGRERDFPTALALAALITLIFNPLVLFSVGFQLSYAATLSIFYLSPLLDKYLFYRFPVYLRRLIAVIVSAQLGILPLTAYYFQQVSIPGLIFNLLFVPVMAFLIGLGLLGSMVYLFSPLLSSIFFMINFPFLSYLLLISGWAKISWFYYPLRPPGLDSMVFWYTALSLAAAYLYRRGSLAGIGSNLVEKIKLAAARLKTPGKTRIFIMVMVLSFLLVITWSGVFRQPDTLTVIFLDVGQGLATYIECSCGFKMMYDGGGLPSYRGDVGEVGERVIVPFLYYRGVKKLDLVVVSHPHEDHFGGFIPVFDRFKVKNLMISPDVEGSLHYEMLLQKAEAGSTAIVVANAGEIYTLSSRLYFEILSPPEKIYRGTGSDLNNNSLVMRLTFGQVNFLFTGDIEETAVVGLLKTKKDFKSAVLQVPHHGGNLPALAFLLQAATPEAAVIPVGTNTFGHPHPLTVSTLESFGLKIFRNDHDGAVIFKTNGRSLWWRTMLKGKAPKSQTK